MVTDIDQEKKRIAISHKLVSENPYSAFEKKYSVNSKLKCTISSIKDLSIYLEIPGFEIIGFLHANDLSYSAKSEEEIKKYRKGDEIEVVVLDIKPKDQKIKFGRKQLEEDPYDRSYTLYNIGLIYGNNGNYSRALEYYHQALELNSNLPQALNNIAVIYHSQGLSALQMQSQENNLELENDEYIELAKEFFDKAGEYWRQALKLAPDNYPGAQNWLKVTGRQITEDF